MIKKKTFEVSYNFFKKGAKVRGSSHRSALQGDIVYTVIKTVEPRNPGDCSLVYLEEYEYGVPGEYIMEVGK